MSERPLRLVIDGIGLPSRPAPQSPWGRLLPALAARPGLALHWLVRGGVLPPVDVATTPFPGHARGACAADSLLLQPLCEHLEADVFVSTGWTTPLAVPTLQLLDAQSLSAAPAAAPAARELDVALAFARGVICASEPTARALAARQPGLRTPLHAIAAADWTQPGARLDALAQQVTALLHQLLHRHRAGDDERFFAGWRRLRTLQADVDIEP